VDPSEYLGLFLDESRESLQALNASLLDLERDPSDHEPLTVIFRVAHSLKGMSATMGFEAMARLTHRMEEVLAAIRDGGAPVTPAITDALFACLDSLQEMVDRVAAGVGEEVDASAVLARLDGIASGDPASAPVVAAAEAAASAPVAAAPAARPAAEHRQVGKVATVRVGTDRLDALMNLMGEMVIQRTRLAQLSAEHDLGDLRGAVEDMTRVTNDLQSLIMQVRMMPVDAVFMRFPRMVRDLANTLGRRLDLQVSGEDTELDRTVIDGLGDPLVHMLRNAVDHGLELPEERVAAGKDPVGVIQLSARHAGNSVVIEVRDDGAGIDPAALRASVVRKGLMNQAAADALSDQEAIDLIFLPGFSTAAQTTDVSGRGVGMDAVRTAITELNGEVTIRSVLGQGSVFTIRLPLTLAIIQALLVDGGADLRGGPQVWAVPLEAIEETVIVDPADTRPVGGRPCMVLRDSVVPLVWLRDCLSLDGAGSEGGAGSIEVVVVRSGGNRMGLVVDGLGGKQDVVIKHLPGFLGDVAGVAGATILGDGSVALIVDVAALSPGAARSAA
jgi:two-component system chemotaxis sensor kinase CheA